MESGSSSWLRCLTPHSFPELLPRCLDGMPLAIELAAARVKTLSVEEIAMRLDDCFRLLTGGSRTALPRQQTLRATMDWSYDLLTEEERVLFRRLAVFAGGWTLEAAESVGSDQLVVDSNLPTPTPLRFGGYSDHYPRSTILDTRARLVDKSLVIVEEQNGQTRYRMLETIRQYAREKLTKSGEASVVQKRYVDFFMKLAEEAEPKLKGADQAAWLQRLEREHDNLRAVLQWPTEGGALEVGLRIASALRQLWNIHGYLSEGRGWLERLLAVAESNSRSSSSSCAPA